MHSENVIIFKTLGSSPPSVVGVGRFLSTIPHQTSPSFIEIQVARQESERSYTCTCCVRVKGIDFPFFYDFPIWFRNCFDSVVYFGFHFNRLYHDGQYIGRGKPDIPRGNHRPVASH